MSIDWEIVLSVVIALIVMKLVDQFLLSRFMPSTYEAYEGEQTA